MKFKYVFILFNITLLLFMVLLVLMPMFVIGPSFSGAFLKTNWIFLLVLLLLFAGFNSFYFINRKLFMLLEKEDWPALIRYLEERVLQKGKYTPRLVKLLANCYLVLSDSAAVMSLENKLAVAKPALVDENVLVFGTARILGRDISGAVRFFAARKDTVKPKQAEWARWYHGFALLLDRRFDESADEFVFLGRTAKDGIVAGLSSFFLRETLSSSLPEKAPELRKAAGEAKERVLAVMRERKAWKKECSRLSTEIYAAAISKYMEEAGNWLYRGEINENI